MKAIIPAAIGIAMQPSPLSQTISSSSVPTSASGRVENSPRPFPVFLINRIGGRSHVPPQERGDPAEWKNPDCQTRQAQPKYCFKPKAFFGKRRVKKFSE